jgi:hypothetical protein
MSYTTSQREALKQAIASGVLSLSYDGKTVTYRSLTDLKAALAEVEQGLAKDSGRHRRVGSRFTPKKTYKRTSP